MYFWYFLARPLINCEEKGSRAFIKFPRIKFFTHTHPTKKPINHHRISLFIYFSHFLSFLFNIIFYNFILKLLSQLSGLIMNWSSRLDHFKTTFTWFYFRLLGQEIFFLSISSFFFNFILTSFVPVDQVTFVSAKLTELCWGNSH